jgi:hypothetical protein
VNHVGTAGEQLADVVDRVAAGVEADFDLEIADEDIVTVTAIEDVVAAVADELVVAAGPAGARRRARRCLPHPAGCRRAGAADQRVVALPPRIETGTGNNGSMLTRSLPPRAFKVIVQLIEPADATIGVRRFGRPKSSKRPSFRTAPSPYRS